MCVCVCLGVCLGVWCLCVRSVHFSGVWVCVSIVCTLCVCVFVLCFVVSDSFRVCFCVVCVC